MKHTPAPWELKITDRFAYIDKGNFEIAELEVGYFDKETELELRANAKLIAAAPELLEALVEMEAFGTRQGWHHVAIEKARAAIDKATN